MAGAKSKNKAPALSPIVEEKVVRRRTTEVDESLVLTTQRVRKPTSKMMDADLPPPSKVKKSKAFPDATSISEPIAKVKKVRF